MKTNATGRLIVINQTQQVSDSYKKRSFVIEIEDVNPKYNQKIECQLSQDKCDLLNNAKIGDIVTIDCQIKGRAWTNPQGETKYFNTIEAWRIALTASQPQAPQQPTAEDDDLGLPF